MVDNTGQARVQKELEALMRQWDRTDAASALDAGMVPPYDLLACRILENFRVIPIKSVEN